MTTTQITRTVPAPDLRLALPQAAPDVYRAMLDLTKAASTGLDPVIAELVRTYASVINGCAFCLDMHTTDARKAGEAEHRLYTLPAWRETPYFTARERAALALTEAITKITEGHVPDAVYQEAAEQFDEQELARLIAAITTINAWNRLAISIRMSPAAKAGV
ncbi:carboxymuconolactone decarboxylase family protein [Kitasatospora sp. NPDC052896]|uniref:carboxymuconolactone decarboxylase family protein n=1 Tax=Kitasatospora sp. NPDC052896 TaxID=3364061 RepID=UPI0037CAB481